MNKRTFTAALLLSALPLYAFAGTAFNKGDFRAAQTLHRGGQTLVRVKLTKSGKAKVRQWNLEQPADSVHTEVGGITSDLRWRGPIQEGGLEMGPYSAADAETIVHTINGD